MLFKKEQLTFVLIIISCGIYVTSADCVDNIAKTLEFKTGNSNAICLALKARNNNLDILVESHCTEVEKQNFQRLSKRFEEINCDIKNRSKRQGLYLSISQLNGRCGYPGKPYRAKLEPDYKLQYEEGEEVTYQCADFWSHDQTRRCEKGKWTGKQPRCGDFIDGLLMKDSKVEDISDPKNPKLIFEHLNMNITNTTWRYPNVFTANRFKKARLSVYDTKPYKWSFKFTYPVVKMFVRINFNFINYKFLTQEMKDNFTFVVTVDVSPHRKCQLIHQSEDIWRKDGRKTNSDFICDSISPVAHKQDLRNPSNYMVMYTQSSIDIEHELIAVFFGKSYGSEDDPFCGEPEVKISQVSRFNIQYKDYLIDCKANRYKYVSPKNGKTPEISIRSRCGPDMKWEYYYPDCVPKRHCPINNLEMRPKTVISSLNGIYFFNETIFYAIEGTELVYGCENPSTDLLIGTKTRICMSSGNWSVTSGKPFCSPIDRLYKILGSD